MKEKILCGIASFFAGIGMAFLFVKWKRKEHKGGTSGKYLLYYDVLNKWMKQKEKGKSIAEKLQQKGINEVAIYGMGDMGKHLQRELEASNIVIKYAIDRSLLAIIDLDVYLPESELPRVDAVIVTPVFDYENVRRCLEEKVTCPILSIADLVNDSLGD